ncbi:hypothetical protein QBC37DRAFT_445203 [Rhypophila decipiens]|uniref:Gag protein n=1 Tax=Rhypophila decipiens TaxID=261697 RepID=A0AAN6XSC2_9PEZI|nr:hypothetical protein QBC37DRAFT_445203 [Rhypophila decipiens]
MANATANNYEDVKFNKPSDWDKWRVAFEKKAEYAGILDYVQPSRRKRKTWPTDPDVPLFDNFQKKQARGRTTGNNNNGDPPEMSGARGSGPSKSANRNTTRRGAATRTQTAGRSRIEQSDHDPDDDHDNTPPERDEDNEDEEEEEEEEEDPAATNTINKTTQFSDLTANGQTDWKIAFELYKVNMSIYNAKVTARTTFSNWVLKSIGPNYQHVTEGHDLPGIYLALREQWLPFRRKINRDLRSEYSSHLDHIKSHERNLSDWTIRWQKLVSDGIKQQIPQISTPSSWYDDLTDALKEIRDGKTWALGELATLEEEILEGIYSHNQVAARMQ